MSVIYSKAKKPARASVTVKTVDKPVPKGTKGTKGKGAKKANGKGAKKTEAEGETANKESDK